ncbi:MAG: prephenate dehydrogenase/arogenate dehydrogenase family protein [Pseudomonadota bacterium]
MFNNVYLIGVGLINASLAKDLKQQKLAKNIVGVGRDEARLSAAKKAGVIDEFQLLVKMDVSDSDVIVIGVPVSNIQQCFELIKPTLKPKTFVTDVGSSKASVIGAAREVFGALPENFVPGHPIAGSEQSGFEHAIASLYKDRKVILTPTENTAEAALSAIQSMWQNVGAHVDVMSAEKHDAILSATSHLPHMVAYSLVSYLANRDDAACIFNYAAGGFYDFTRIASSDPTMWSDICIENKNEIIKSIEGFTKNLNELKSKIEKQDKQAIYESFSKSRKSRNENLKS